VLLAAIPAVFGVLAQRQLYADGAWWVILVLERHGFTVFDVPRQHAHYLIQLPMWILLNVFGSTDVHALSLALGLSLLGIPVLGLAASAWVLRRRPRAFAALPFLCFVALGFSTSLFLVSETWVAMALFWPVYFLLADRRRELTALEGALLVGAALVLVRVYEGFFLSSALLAWLSLRRLDLRMRRQLGWDGWALIALGLFAAGCVLDLYWTLSPRDAGNRASFLDRLRTFPDQESSKLLVASVLLLAGPKIGRGSLGAAVRALLLAALAAFGFSIAREVWLHPELLVASRHADVRFLNTVLPPALAVVPFLAARFRRFRPAVGAAQRMGLVALSAALCLWQLGVTRRWEAYLDRFRYQLASGSGLVPLERTGLSPYGFDFRWTSSSLSLVLGAQGPQPLRALVVDPLDGGYRPFAPEKGEWPDLSRYGLRVEIGIPPAPARPGEAGR
jgi:hypothetical protein